MIGTRLGQYQIVAALGAGGMGEVYRATDARLGREVAIKVLPARLAADRSARARFEREAQAVAALSHPNILAIHEFGQQDGVAFAVMELLEGETLRARLDRGALPMRKLLQIGAEIADGLAAAHDKGIVHRDLKPENVFVTADGRVKILDFGLARRETVGFSGETPDGETALAGTDPGTVMGTVGYMAPEQVTGQPSDARADIFALGCVLFEMASGRRAFARATVPETMTAILREEPSLATNTGSRPAGVRCRCASLPREAANGTFPVGTRPRVRPPLDCGLELVRRTAGDGRPRGFLPSAALSGSDDRGLRGRWHRAGPGRPIHGTSRRNATAGRTRVRVLRQGDRRSRRRDDARHQSRRQVGGLREDRWRGYGALPAAGGVENAATALGGVAGARFAAGVLSRRRSNCLPIGAGRWGHLPDVCDR